MTCEGLLALGVQVHNVYCQSAEGPYLRLPGEAV